MKNILLLSFIVMLMTSCKSNQEIKDQEQQ